MAVENSVVVARWADDVAANKMPKHWYGGTVRTDTDGTIWYDRRSGRDRHQWGPVVLGRFYPKRKLVLLNGDGFTDRSATQWQTALRGRAQRAVRESGNDILRVAVIPYAALSAAGIAHDSILPIHVVRDEVEQVWHRVDLDETRIETMQPVIGSQGRSRTYEFSSSGTTFRMVWTATWSRGTYTNWPQGNQVWTANVTLDPNTLVQGWPQVIHSRDFPTAQARLDAQNRQNEQWGRPFIASVWPEEEGWYWADQIHHLGACLFSAVDRDGGRHKFVSAFDPDEPQRMYFLAQLPDRSGATTYDEAILALAPQIVHQAWLEGRQVRRQGDVFAIRTNMTDEQVFGMARTRVRRAVAMADSGPGRFTSQAMQQWWGAVTPAKGEVRERIVCPCGCGHKGWRGCGPKAQAALSIYRTGHTATEVVVTAKGVTYIRGVMHHDPGLQEPGRRPEHRDVDLDDGWWLAVRNTVPRRKPRRVEAVEEEVVEVAAA